MLEVLVDGTSGIGGGRGGGADKVANTVSNVDGNGEQTGTAAISEPASVSGSILNPASSYWSLLGASRDVGAFDDLESDVFGNASVAVNSEVIDPLAYKIPCPVSSGGETILYQSRLYHL
jgi:hypothetical protein